MIVYTDYFNQYQKADEEKYKENVEKLVKKYRTIELEQRDMFIEDCMELLPIIIKRDADEERFTVKRIVQVLNTFTDREITYNLQKVVRATSTESMSYYRVKLHLK